MDCEEGISQAAGLVADRTAIFNLSWPMCAGLRRDVDFFCIRRCGVLAGGGDGLEAEIADSRSVGLDIFALGPARVVDAELGDNILPHLIDNG